MNYGVIGNCQVAALIDEQARMVWACLPRPDGDPVFSALLQKEGGESDKGVFAIEMLDLTRSEQSYQRNSAIIETRLLLMPTPLRRSVRETLGSLPVFSLN